MSVRQRFIRLSTFDFELIPESFNSKSIFNFDFLNCREIQCLLVIKCGAVVLAIYRVGHKTTTITGYELF